jgi:phosphopantothenoylcysteine synthetase/decarboxylase
MKAKISDRAPRVVLGVSGSIAAFRAADLASRLTKAGIEVDVVLTRGAESFVTPLTFGSLTRRQVTRPWSDQLREGQPAHIWLADRADLVMVAPATAHCLAKYAQGLADDELSCTLLATEAPVLVAPAMNGKMWRHPATQANVALLKSRGVEFIGPDEGLLACGYEGIGRLWPVEGIAAAVLARFQPSASG